MSRRGVVGWLLALVAFASPSAASAQSEDGATGSPPERIDLTAATAAQSGADALCKRRREAALISGEIVVCGGREGDAPPTLGDKSARQNRYARETMNQGTLPTPDVAGRGIFRGPATVGGICVKGVFNCPKPPALMVDVSKLPQAPPGSDADRIARGLDPLGDDSRAQTQPAMSAGARAELDLPPAANGGENPAPESPPPASPAESAGPAAPR